MNNPILTTGVKPWAWRACLYACIAVCLMVLPATSVIAAPLPAANGSHYFTDSSTLVGGTALRSKLVASGDSLYLKVFANYDTPAWLIGSYGLIFEWDPTALRLDETWPIAPRGATLDAAAPDGNGVNVWSPDTGTGRYAAQITFSAGFPSGNLDTAYYLVRFTKLNALTTTINLIPDTDPAEIQFLTKGGCGFVNSTGLWSIQPNTAKMYNLQVYSQESAAPTFANATLNPMVQNQACSVTNVLVYDSSAALGMRSCTLWVTAGTIPVAWQPITLTASTDTTLTHDTVISYYGTIPADSLAAPRIYYFFSATDTWGNTRFSKTGANFTDTTNADSVTVYSNVPLTITGVGRGYGETTPVTDIATNVTRAIFETDTPTAILWVTTSADTVSILVGTTSLTGTETAVWLFPNFGASGVLACTVPLTANSLNYIQVVGHDTLLPATRTGTYVITHDTSAPDTPSVLLVNNSAAPVVSNSPCSLYVTAFDTVGVKGYYFDFDTNALYGFQVYDTDLQRNRVNMEGGGCSTTITIPTASVGPDSTTTLYLVAFDTVGNFDTLHYRAITMKYDVVSPLVFGEDLGTLRLPSDSQVRTNAALDVRIVIADSGTVAAALLNYRHNYVGTETWATAAMSLLGSLGGDFKMYGCTIPASVVGTVVTGATGRLNMYGRITDQFGRVTSVDSRGVTLNESATTDSGEQAGGYHSFTASDSVFVQVLVNTDSRVTRGLPYDTRAWGSTMYVSGDTLLVQINAYADTILYFFDSVLDSTCITAIKGYWSAPVYRHTLHTGINQLLIKAYDDTEPSREGPGDTIYIYCDTIPPAVTLVNIETGSVAIDSGVSPTLTVQVTGVDTFGISGTPDYLVLADTAWANGLNRLADEDTTVLGTLRVVRVPYTGLGSYPWNGGDTTLYRVFAFGIDRAGNVSQLTANDTVFHDTKGPQITFAGISDPQGCSYPVNLSLSTYDLSTVSEVRLFYRHDSAGVAYWAETTAQPAGGNNWTAVIPDSVTGTTPDTGMGVRYFLRATDAMGHINYWCDTDGLMPYSSVNWNDTSVYSAVAGINTANRDAVAKTDYYYDTFGVVTGVSTTVTVSDSYGPDSLPVMSLTTNYYFDSSAIWVRVNTSGVADSTIVKNVTLGVTITTYGDNSADTFVFLPLKAGANSLQVYAYDTQLPATTLNYTVYADTDAPQFITGSLFGRIYMNPVSSRDYTDSSGFYLTSTVTDTTSSVAQYRIGEDAAFITGRDTSWQTYAAATGYVPLAQDTVVLYVQFRDPAGNMTAALGPLNVYADTQGPQITLNAAVADSRAANATLNLSLTLRDESGDTLLSNARGFIWYSNPNQYGGGVGGWDSQAIIYNGTGYTWSCSIPAAVIGPLPDSSVAWFIEAYDTWSKASYLVGAGGTNTLCYTETLSLAQAKTLADTFTTIDSVAVQTWIRDSNDTLAGQVLISNGKVVNSDTLYLRFVTDADTIQVRINNTLAADTAFGYDSYGASDTVVATLGLRAGANFVNIAGWDYSMPNYSCTFVIFCDTVAPPVALASLALADNDRCNYVAADTLALRAWFTARDTTSAVGAYRWSATSPVSSTWLSFASPALALSETVNITLSSGTTVLTVYVQVQDTAGNISDTFIDTILYDTQAPLIYYAGVQDSQAAAAPVTVLPLFYDLSGTTALTAYLYANHASETSTWLLLNMSPTGASGTDTSYFTANIPDTVVGHADTTAPMTAYVIAVKDWFDQWRYYGYNGDSSFASLAAAQAAPDSFTTVWSIAVTAQIIDVDSVAASLVDGIYVNSTTCTVHINSPGADTIQLGRYTQSGTLLDTKSYFNATADPDTWVVIGMVFDTNYLVVYVQDTVVAGQPQPAFWRKYVVYCDTYAPGVDTARINNGLATTDRLNVTLNLSASDTDNNNHIFNGVRYMQFAQNAGFTVNATSGTIPYATSYAYTCTSAGFDSTLTVFMRFYDYAGNYTTVSDTISYDTEGPLIILTPVTDSRPINRAIQLTATVSDISETATYVALVTYHLTGTWDTVVMTATGPTTFVGSIPAAVVGGSADLNPGVSYYLAASDSWGQWRYWADSWVLGTYNCTTIAYARQFADTFTVSLPVSVAVAAADRDSSTYAAMNVWQAGWTPQYYKSDSFAIRVTTNADSLAVYLIDRNLVSRQVVDTMSLTQGATNQVRYISLSDTMLYDTMFIQVVGFDYTEPLSTETYAIIADTTVPIFAVRPYLNAGVSSCSSATLTVTMTGVDTYSVAYMIVSETHPMDMFDTVNRWVAYSAASNYTLTRPVAQPTVYVTLIDTAGNYTTASDSILYDTQAPQFVYARVADSQSANQNVAVRPTITDLTGTTTLTVTLYYRHPTDTAAWASSAMTALPDGTFLGSIPASVVGVDTVNRVEYVIAATDTHNWTRYFGANGDTSFATLAAAQAKPDSFTIVTPIATTVRAWDADDAAWQVMSSGLVFNNATLRLAVAPDTSVADSITIWVRNIKADLTGTDSLVYNGYIPMLVAGYDTFTIPMLVTWDYCTYTVRVIVRDTAGVVPNYDNQWTVVCDTVAPLFGQARIGSNPATDTFISAVSQSVIFTAQDSYGVSTVYHYGNVTTTGTAAYTAAAQTVTFSAGEGWKNLFHYYQDAAGNFSAVFGDSFYLDVTSGTVTIVPSPLAVAVAAYTCTGTVVDNRIETPAFVYVRLNGGTDSSLAVTPATGRFTAALNLASGVNTIRVTATDSSGNSSFDELTVTLASAVAAAPASVATPVAATISDTAGGSVAIVMGTADSATISVTSASGFDTLVAVIDFALAGYTVTVQRLDTATTANIYGAAGSLNGVNTTSYLALDSFIVRFSATDSQGNPVSENSSTPYDGITLTWYYGASVSAADEPNLHVYYFDPTDSLWKLATSVTGLVVAGATEQRSLTNDTISLRVTHLSTWGIFVGGVAVAANLNNVVIFPNPFKPYDGLASTGEPYNGNPNSMTGIHFTNLAASTEVKIYTTNGELVAEATSAANDGMLVWDARNKGGEEVASGIYLVVFKQGGQVVVKKLAIIR